MIAIAICKTAIPMGEFRWTMFDPCFANRFSLDNDFDSSLRTCKMGVFGTKLRKTAIYTADQRFTKQLSYGRSSLDNDDSSPDNDDSSPLERIKQVSMHSNGEMLFARQ